MLRANAIIGFQFEFYDDDGGTVNDLSIQRLSDPKTCEICTEFSAFLADSFVDGQLIPCQRGDCSGEEYSPSAVSTDSWARIKASLR